MTHSFKFFTTLFIVLLCTAAFGQVQQIDFSSYGGQLPAKINGVVQVSAFDYNVASQGAAGFASWNSFSSGCAQVIPGYGAAVPFSSSAVVKVNDFTTPANTETVALSTSALR